MKLKEISYKAGFTHPYIVITREARNKLWTTRHVHYYKHEFMLHFRMWIDNKVIYKIRNWFIRRK